MDTLEWYEKEISRVAIEAFSNMMKDSIQRQYLWFTRGSIVSSSDQPSGMELVTAEAIPNNIDIQAIRSWIWERCRRVSCLPNEATEVTI